MITSDVTPRTAFAYVAGNWDLDAGRGGSNSHGITNQIQELFNHGCYADFTFSTIGTSAQPAKVNSLYYVCDDAQHPKSYDDGIDAKVGTCETDKLLMFEGPIAIDWNGAVEYGALESDPRFHPAAVKRGSTQTFTLSGGPSGSL